MNTKSNEEFNWKERLIALRKMIEHEDNIINHRMSWFGVFQGLLFTAFAATYKSEFKNICEFRLLLPYFGIAVSLSFFISFWCSSKALKNLKGIWRGKETEIPPVGLDLDDYGMPLKLLRIFLPWHFLPWIIIITSLMATQNPPLVAT